MARPGFTNNVKFKLLCRLLGVGRAHTLGLVELLWAVAHESGNPVIGSPEAVEAAAEWDGEPGKFFAAMRSCRLIDERGGLWEIHDYWHHAPEYVKGRRRKEEQRIRSRHGTVTDSAVTVTGQSRDSHGTVMDSAGNGCDVRATPSPSPSPSPSPGKEEEGCPETAEPSSGPPSAPVLVFEVDGGGKTWTLTEAKVGEYRLSYPSLDVIAECRRAWQWIKDNPERRKTARGMPAFLGRWLGKAQERGHGRGPPLGPTGKLTTFDGVFEDLP